MSEVSTTCPECGRDYDQFGQYQTTGGQTYCYACGREKDGLTPVPIDPERDTVRDYCREEADELTEAAALEEWTTDLSDAGAEWSDDSSISGTEVGWKMTLNQAFWLALNRGWFSPEGFYQGPLEQTLVGLMTIHDPADDDCSWEGEELAERQRKDAERQVRNLWEKFRADEANREKTTTP